MTDTDALLDVRNIKKIFDTKQGPLHAIDDVSFTIKKGETLGLVGESGCGKSTLGRVLIRLVEATDGSAWFGGKDIFSLNGAQMKQMRKRMQIVFQDPYSSLNPRLNIADLIAEPLIVHKVCSSASDMKSRVMKLMDMVGLARRLHNAFPHELDGGRRQRIGVARALALDPEFIVLDEPVSALDVCIQAQILNLLSALKREANYTYLFISHNMSVVKHVSDRIAVMYLGKIVELADYESIFDEPAHPYTQALLSAIPIPQPGARKDRILLEGEVPSPIDLPPGCRFSPRCSRREDICELEQPELAEFKPGHSVACHVFARGGRYQGTYAPQDQIK
ncbi:MAG: ATP-binding cassette domain-containing protein [Synergistaceae bacterium]|jgi:peptide/nickel transport system ATP-binding protein|nr:ATP-binding cassette domain-containing protein [Synergistaceae bacterium]